MSSVLNPPSPGRPRILSVLPRGEAIRNFVYSGSLDLLAREAEVTVQSVYPSDEVVDLLIGRYGSVHELPELHVPLQVGVARALVAEAHNRMLWSAAARDRHLRRLDEAPTHASRLKARSWQLLGRPFASPRGTQFLADLEQWVSGRCTGSVATAELLDRSSPSLVFNASHVHADNAMDTVHQAKRRGLRVATFLFSWDNLTSQGRISPEYDHYLVWNEQIGHDLRAIYPRVSSAAVTVTGTPQFDPHFWPDQHLSRNEVCSRIGVDPNRPLVLYTTGMANHMPHEPEIVEALARSLGDRTDLGRPQVVLRVYAKDRSGRFEHLRGRLDNLVEMPVLWEPNWLTPLPEDTVLWSSVLAAVDCGINVASTVSLELAMFDKPVVNVGYSPPSLRNPALDYARYYKFDHYRPIVESGAISVAGSHHEALDAIAEAIRRPRQQRSARAALIAELFGPTLDGQSHARVASALLELAR